MAQPLATASKARWGIPLVLPHVLLSLGLLVFAALSEPPHRSESVRATRNIASVAGAPISRRVGRS